MEQKLMLDGRRQCAEMMHCKQCCFFYVITAVGAVIHGASVRQLHT